MKPRRRPSLTTAPPRSGAAGRQTRRLRLLALACVAALAIAVAALAAALSGPTPTGPLSSDTSPASVAFGPNYAGLRKRVQNAGLPTMATAGSTAHTHQSLAVYVDGKQIPVPENVGIDPRADGGDMAGLHTHIPGYTLHNEGVPRPTLGQFFTVWGVTLTRSQLGFRRTGRGERVRLWVNGKPSDRLAQQPLADRQRLVVALGPEDAPAPPGPPEPEG